MRSGHSTGRCGAARRDLIVLLALASGCAWPMGTWARPGATAPARGEIAGAPAPGAEAGAGTDQLETEESLARHQQLLERRPFHGPAFASVVGHYVERGKLDELVRAYEERWAALPENVATRVILARLRLRAGDAGGAARALEGIEALPAELARHETDLLALRAEVQHRAGDDEGAERTLRKALSIAPGLSEQFRLSEALADMALRRGSREEAAAALTELGAKHRDVYLHQRRVGDALARRGLHEAAEAQWRATLELVGNEVDRRCETLRDLGQALERVGKRDEAIAAYVEAIGLLSSDHWLQADLHERVVGLHRAAGRLEDLAAYCEGRMERAPEQTAMRVLLADVQAALGKAELGKRTLSDAVALFPDDLLLSRRRIEFLERLGDLEGASAEHERAIGRHPDDAELYIAYGQSLAANRMVDAARNQWRHVLSTRVADAGLAVRLGALFEAHDLHEDAAEAYERAIALSARQPEAYAALSRLRLLRGDAEGALDALRRMGDANPEDASVQAELAQALHGMGRIEDALSAIERAAGLAPAQVRHQVVRSDLLVQAGRLEEAMEVRRDAIALLPSASQRAEAAATLVSMHASAGRLPALREREERALATNPQDEAALRLLARAADTERDFAGSKKWIERLLDRDPGDEPALRQLAKLRDATGDAGGATEIYARLAQLHPARARQFYEAIVELKLRYGDRAGAIETLERMIAADPGNGATLSAVGEQLVRMGEPERALTHYETSLRLAPERHEARLEYGKALVEAGRLEDAARELRVVATQRADTDRAAEALGQLHDAASKLGALDDLIDELRREVEADPENTLVARALAQLLVRELEYGQAMELLDFVLRHNPRDAELALGRAELLRRLARVDEAVEAYQRALRLPQIDRDYVLGELGKAWFESGQVDQARRLWRQIGHKLYAGTLLKNNGLVDEAIAVFEEGLRLKPDDYALHRNLIGALEAAGRTADALATARRLLDLEPANTWNIERLAAAHLRSGDRAGAAAVAARLFSASVGPDKSDGRTPGSMAGFLSVSYSVSAAQMGSSSYFGGGRQARSNLDRGIEFFQRNGLTTELEAALEEQMAAQPGNAVLKYKAAELFEEMFAKPERALALLRELESASFPIEHQPWLGQCSQRDFMRVRQCNLMAAKPALRDRERGALEAKDIAALTRDDLITLAAIRRAQGASASAAELLERAVAADASDTMALGALVDLLVKAERFGEAEPHARALVERLGGARAGLQAEMIERVRRDFVRSLPIEMQLRVTEDLLADIADKWTLGETYWWGAEGRMQTMGYLRARLTLATILAETGRMEEARAAWEALAPTRGPDVDRWTLLGDVAQLYKQGDLAHTCYRKGLEAARALAGDALLQQVYTSSGARSWYGDTGVDASFNAIVESFAQRDALLELYDFLRDTDQEKRARRLAAERELGKALEERFAREVAGAAERFRGSDAPALVKSVPYFASVCKLAEVYDRAGDWERAEGVYASYLADFPDELGLLTMLGEVAEARLETAKAIEYERRALECKARLARRAREWALREIALTPSCPVALGEAAVDSWSWNARWGRSGWQWGGGQRQMDRAESWMRLARLHLADGNTIAAGDAMQRAVAESGGDRPRVATEVVRLIQQRQLTAQMLPVLRTLAVYAPMDERVQLAFSESLEAAGRGALAVEVCQRMLRRGVSDLGTLGEAQRRLRALDPEHSASEATLASLERESAADPANLKARLRLAKARHYSLDVEGALALLEPLAKEAPHLEDVHGLLVEAYTLRGDQQRLIEALRAQIERTAEDGLRTMARWRLVDELLSAGRTDEALTEATALPDPRDPDSYGRVGALLHYFGRHEEATACIEGAGKSQTRNPWDQSGPQFGVAESLALRGDRAGAAERILKAIDEQSGQRAQLGGMSVMQERRGGAFARLNTMFVLEPEIAERVRGALEARLETKPKDPATIAQLADLHDALGRPDLAEALLERSATEGASDQTVASRLIDKAVKRRDFARAIELARAFIAEQPKPQLPPGVPAQYAEYMLLESPRTLMACRLGDIHWKMGDRDNAFEAYAQIVDEKVDATRTAFASICLLRGRVDKARELIDASLASQSVKPPALLNLRAVIAAAEGDAEGALRLSAQAAAGPKEEDWSGREESALDDLGALALRTGMVDAFAALMEERIARNPQEADGHFALARTLRDAGRMEEALRALDRAGQVGSLAAQALELRAAWTAGTAGLEEEIALLRTLVEQSERGAGQSANTRQRMMGMGGDGSTARRHRDRLGDLLWEAGRRDEARAVWTERMDARNPGALLMLAGRHEGKGDYDEAGRARLRAVELAPENAEARLAAAADAGARGDRRAQLDHMVVVFRAGRTLSGSAQDPFAQVGQNFDERMRAWAVELRRDPAALAEATGDDADTLMRRITLASLACDRAELEGLLRGPIEAGTVDPLLWSLWADVQQSDADWAETARALEFVRRAKLTTIGRHRDQLKLVLAGGQVKEAAAGTRQAQAGAAQPAPGMNPARMYSTGHVMYLAEHQAAQNSALPTALVKLGEHAKAERLHLLSSSGGVRAGMRSLASLMWEQGERERALELMRSAMLLTDNQQWYGQSPLPAYAAALAQVGRTEEARDVLVRAYRWLQGYEYSMPEGEAPPFESREERTISAELARLLRTAGTLEEALDDLKRQAAADPEDARLARLVISLQGQDRRWSEVRESLAAWCAARPDDIPARVELLHTEIELQSWERALAELEEARKRAPEGEATWRRFETVIRFAMGDAEGAVTAATRPAGPEGEEQEPELRPLGAALPLAIAGKLEQVVERLRQTRKEGELDEQGADLLLRSLEALGRREEALALAFEELWREQSAFALPDRWVRGVARLGAGGGSGSGPEEGAMLALLTDGARAGLDAFGPLAEGEGATLEAMRGLVFAATLAGEHGRAVEANGRLLEWLSARRMSAWRTDRLPALERDVARMLRESGRSGAVRAVTSGMSRVSLGGLLEMAAGRGTPVLYGELWRSHALLQRTLLARAGRVDDLKALLREQERTMGDTDRPEDEWMNYRYSSGGSYTYMNSNRNSQGKAGPDAGLREALWAAGAIGVLREAYGALGARTPQAEWMRASEVAAAAGDGEEASRLARSAAAAKLAAILGAPAQEAAHTQHESRLWARWRQEQDASMAQGALRSVGTEDDERRATRGDVVWIHALTDAAFEERLLACEPLVAEGAGVTALARELVAFHRAKKAPERVIALLERALGPEGSVAESAALADYLRACFSMKDVARIERTLDAVVRTTPSLRADADVLRLAALRMAGRDAEAEALERSLLERATPRRPSQVRVHPSLVDRVYKARESAEMARQVSYGSSHRSGGQQRQHQPVFTSSVDTIPALASALGVHNQRPAAGAWTVSLADIRAAHERLGLHAHSARLLGLELEACKEAQDRWPLLVKLAEAQAKAGNSAGARAVVAELERDLRAHLERVPGDVDALWRLGQLYMTDAAGPDYARAAEVIGRARRMDPGYDPDAGSIVRCLYELGKPAEALRAWREAEWAGQARAQDATTLLYAALSACRAEGAGKAGEMARRALHRFPSHRLAGELREVMHERE